MKLSGFLITIYFEKAFDSVSHNFLNKTLKAFKYRSILYQMSFQSKLQFKVARNHLFMQWLHFRVAFFGRDNFTYFFDFGVVKEKCSNLKKMLFIF